MKTKTITAILIATTLTFVGTSYAHQSTKGAQHHNMSGGMMGMQQNGQMGHMSMGYMQMGNMGMGFSQLNLTEQQQQEMQEMMASSQGQNTGWMANMQAHHAEMQALMESDTFDDNMAKEMLERHQLQMSESRLTMLKTRHQMYQLLSDEQKEEFRNMQQSRMMNMYPK